MRLNVTFVILYACRWSLVIKSSLPVLETVAHHSFLSDHKYVKMELKLPEVVKKAKKKKDLVLGN